MDTATFIWMFFILKIPILAALWLIWWAVQEPEPVVDEDQDEGGSDRRDHPRPRRPRPPRRGGPHASPPPTAKPRVRITGKGPRIHRH